MDEITAAQAATLTGLSERTIRRKIASGLLVARRIEHNRFAIKVADLPVRSPVNALAQRMEVLEERLAEVEATLQSSIDDRAGSSGTAATPLVGAELQQIFAHVINETARLAWILSVAQGELSGLAPALTPPFVEESK